MHQNNLKKIVFVLLFSMIPCTLLALGPPPGKGKADKGKPDKAKNEKKEDREDLKHAQDVVDLLVGGISAKDARRFASENSLTGRKALPPGIAKNLAKGKPIPPGISKQKIPSSFLKKLPVHEGKEWHLAGTDLLLVNKADKLVAEILKDVFK